MVCRFGAELCANRAKLYALANFLGRSRATADDLVQETLERAMCHADAFESGTNLLAWLSRIMRNLFADKMRRQACEQRLLPPPPPPNDELDPGDPLEVLDASDVQAALARLPERYRAPFELVSFEKRSLKRVAAHLGITVSAAGVRIFRARRMMRVLLMQRYEELRQQPLEVAPKAS
jgi:RNA polymerase sigma-70 factor (ECF subfamily)